ncbi:MAG: thiosulfate oxidation carrier complex protein SoxZ [Thiohalospira sp.]
MPSNTIRARASVQDGTANVKALVSHPMETGEREDKDTGDKIPAHYIEEMTVKRNGDEILVAEMSSAISKNPYVSFRFDGASSGDTLSISWKDNKGESDSTETKIG